MRGEFAGHADGGHEHVLFAHDEVRRVQAGQLKAVSVGDGIGGAGFDAVSAEDAAVVVNVVDLRVTLGAGDAVLGRVLGGFNIDAVRGAGRGAEKAGDALFQAIFIALKHVRTAEAVLQNGAACGAGAVRVVLYLGRLEHLLEGDAHSLADGRDVAHNGHASSIERGSGCRKSGWRSPALQIEDFCIQTSFLSSRGHSV